MVMGARLSGHRRISAGRRRARAPRGRRCPRCQRRSGGECRAAGQVKRRRAAAASCRVEVGASKTRPTGRLSTMRPAGVTDGHPVRDPPDHPEVVGDEQVGDPASRRMEVKEQQHDLATETRDVEGPRSARSQEDEPGAVTGRRAGDRDPLDRWPPEKNSAGTGLPSRVEADPQPSIRRRLRQLKRRDQAVASPAAARRSDCDSHRAGSSVPYGSWKIIAGRPDVPEWRPARLEDLGAREADRAGAI